VEKVTYDAYSMRNVDYCQQFTQANKRHDTTVVQLGLKQDTNPEPRIVLM
jgi:hypothetical protein